jgi:hypothetical protein
VEFQFMVEMNLVQIGTNEFFSNSFVSLRTKGACSPARTATRNWGSKCSVGTVPNENSVRPASDAIPRGEAKSVSRSRPYLSLANEIRRCTRVQVSTVWTLISKPRGEAARSLVDSGFSGSPPFVAVMQPTDLRYRHDGPHFRRLNRSWLR